MWCSTKKENGTLRLMKMNTTSYLHLMKKRHLNMFNKSSSHASTSTTHRDTLPSLDSERAVSHTRTIQDLFDQPERLDNITLFCLSIDCEPVDFEEVMQDKRWRDAMDEEIKSIEKNDTWERVSLPKGHKAIGVKWVYKTKKNAKGEIERYKARLVAKGWD